MSMSRQQYMCVHCMSKVDRILVVPEFEPDGKIFLSANCCDNCAHSRLTAVSEVLEKLAAADNGRTSGEGIVSGLTEWFGSYGLTPVVKMIAEAINYRARLAVCTDIIDRMLNGRMSLILEQDTAGKTSLRLETGSGSLDQETAPGNPAGSVRNPGNLGECVPPARTPAPATPIRVIRCLRERQNVTCLARVGNLLFIGYALPYWRFGFGFGILNIEGLFFVESNKIANCYFIFHHVSSNRVFFGSDHGILCVPYQQGEPDNVLDKSKWFLEIEGADIVSGSYGSGWYSCYLSEDGRLYFGGDNGCAAEYDFASGRLKNGFSPVRDEHFGLPVLKDEVYCLTEFREYLLKGFDNTKNPILIASLDLPEEIKIPEGIDHNSYCRALTRFGDIIVMAGDFMMAFRIDNLENVPVEGGPPSLQMDIKVHHDRLLVCGAGGLFAYKYDGEKLVPDEAIRNRYLSLESDHSGIRTMLLGVGQDLQRGIPATTYGLALFLNPTENSLWLSLESFGVVEIMLDWLFEPEQKNADSAAEESPVGVQGGTLAEEEVEYDETKNSILKVGVQGGTRAEEEAVRTEQKKILNFFLYAIIALVVIGLNSGQNAGGFFYFLLDLAWAAILWTIGLTLMGLVVDIKECLKEFLQKHWRYGEYWFSAGFGVRSSENDGWFITGLDKNNATIFLRHGMRKLKMEIVEAERRTSFEDDFVENCVKALVRDICHIRESSKRFNYSGFQSFPGDEDLMFFSFFHQDASSGVIMMCSGAVENWVKARKKKRVMATIDIMIHGRIGDRYQLDNYEVRIYSHGEADESLMTIYEGFCEFLNANVVLTGETVEMQEQLFDISLKELELRPVPVSIPGDSGSAPVVPGRPISLGSLETVGDGHYRLRTRGYSWSQRVLIDRSNRIHLVSWHCEPTMGLLYRMIQDKKIKVEEQLDCEAGHYIGACLDEEERIHISFLNPAKNHLVYGVKREDDWCLETVREIPDNGSTISWTQIRIANNGIHIFGVYEDVSRDQKLMAFFRPLSGGNWSEIELGGQNTGWFCRVVSDNEKDFYLLHLEERMTQGITVAPEESNEAFKLFQKPVVLTRHAIPSVNLTGAADDHMPAPFSRTVGATQNKHSPDIAWFDGKIWFVFSMLEAGRSKIMLGSFDGEKETVEEIAEVDGLAKYLHLLPLKTGLAVMVINVKIKNLEIKYLQPLLLENEPGGWKMTKFSGYRYIDFMRMKIFCLSDAHVNPDTGSAVISYPEYDGADNEYIHFIYRGVSAH